MGIGNTTAASAMTAAILEVPADEVTGSGTGIDSEVLAHKVDVVRHALATNQPGRDPLAVLRMIGGFEIAAIAGAYVGAAAHRMAIVGDGFIAAAAALVAAAICPPFLDYWFAGHRSSEPGHPLQLGFLRQQPLLDLEMRLGEGTSTVDIPYLCRRTMRWHRLSVLQTITESRQFQASQELPVPTENVVHAWRH